MNIKSRLEIYPSDDVKGRAVIVGERQALKELAYALIRAATDATGFHSVNLYKGNGHDYEIFVTRNVSETEWQNIPSKAEGIEFVAEYESVKNSIKNNVL